MTPAPATRNKPGCSIPASQSFRRPIRGPRAKRWYLTDGSELVLLMPLLLLAVVGKANQAAAAEDGPILLAPSLEDLQPAPPNSAPSESVHVAPAPSPSEAATSGLPGHSSSPADRPANSPFPAELPANSPMPADRPVASPSPAELPVKSPIRAEGQGGWVRAGTVQGLASQGWANLARANQGWAEGETPATPGEPAGSLGSPSVIAPAPPVGQPPGMFYGTARPLSHPAAMAGPYASRTPGGFSSGGQSSYTPYPGAGATAGALPYSPPGSPIVPPREPERGWFGLPKLDLSKLKLNLDKWFQRKPRPQGPATPPAPAMLVPSNRYAWRGSPSGNAAAGYPPSADGNAIRQPDWNHVDPPQTGLGSGGRGVASPNDGLPVTTPGMDRRTRWPSSTWDPRNPYAAPYAVPPQADADGGTRLQALPLTALPPTEQPVGASSAATPSSVPGDPRFAWRASNGGVATSSGSPAVSPALAPANAEGSFFGKPNFWDRVKVWWKDVTTPRRDRPRTAFLPPRQAWQNLQSRLQPRPQIPGQDPFAAQRGGWGTSYTSDPAAMMGYSRYSPAILPPPPPHLPGSIPHW